MTVPGLPFLASEHGAQVDKLILYVHYLMLILFIGWSAYFVYVLFRFRQKRNPKADYLGAKTHASTYIEVGVIIGEAFLLIGLAVPFWARAVDKFPAESESTVLRVIGRQFNWIAFYPGADHVFARQDDHLAAGDNPLGIDKADPKGKDDVIVETSEIAVPVNKPVIMHISALDVVHSFKVTPLRVTQDAIPGMTIPIHFKPTAIGNYRIDCAQLCGNGHFSMKGEFKVLSAEDYDKWLKTKSAATGVSFE